LYVGDLAQDVTEALLFEIFNAVGPVASVRVCRDAATRRSLGYAYVNFHRVDDAERALDTLNFKNIRSRPCRIMWSHRDPSLRRSGLGNIFVNGLAKPIDNKQLFDTFSVFGNILSCKVATNSKRESLGYAFVHFETDESAANAISKVDGKVIAGEKVTVQAFKSKKERTGGQSKNTFSNVFVKNLPADVSKEALDALFAKHGTITSSMISPAKDTQDPTKAAAFGFVNYSAPEEATAAVDALNNVEFQGKKLFVGRAQKKEEREKELRDRFEQLKL
jgi:polyadenylate-binding protein